MSLIDKFFSIRKTGSMDANMKEAVDQMEEVEVELPEKVVVYHMLKNLPSEYDTFKHVILHERKSPTFLELEARLLNEELNRRDSRQELPEALAATSRGYTPRRGHSRWAQLQRTQSGSSSHTSRNLSIVYNQLGSSSASSQSKSTGYNGSPSAGDQRRDRPEHEDR